MGHVGRNLVLLHRRQILRCAPEQVRHATQEEKTLISSTQAEMLGVKDLLSKGNLESKQLVDLISDAHPPVEAVMQFFGHLLFHVFSYQNLKRSMRLCMHRVSTVLDSQFGAECFGPTGCRLGRRFTLERFWYPAELEVESGKFSPTNRGATSFNIDTTSSCRRAAGRHERKGPSLPTPHGPPAPGFLTGASKDSSCASTAGSSLGTVRAGSFASKGGGGITTSSTGKPAAAGTGTATGRFVGAIDVSADSTGG